MEPTQLIALVSVTLNGLALIFAIRHFWRNQDSQLFVAYGKRYDDIISELYTIIPPTSLKDAAFAPTDQAHLTRIMLRYYNLCSEEAWMFQHRFIRATYWQIWQEEMKQHVKYPHFASAWD